jgi:dCMP deaminase
MFGVLSKRLSPLLFQTLQKDKFMNTDRKKAYFMRVAEETALLSHAVKLKVGAVAVRDNRIICTGYNGTGPGEDNCCETVHFHQDDPAQRYLKTKDNVTHAEKNLIDFAARKGIALEGAELFVTHSPCMACARSIANVGFTHVYYKTNFSHVEGLEYLKEARGVTITQLSG